VANDRAAVQRPSRGAAVIVVVIADHYQRLGVSQNASRDQIRDAYRELARRNHPDARGEASAAAMAQINEAWRVLSDPDRRAVYDAQIRRSYASTAMPGKPWMMRPTIEREPVEEPPEIASAKFPWRFMLVLATLGIGFVLVNAALTKPSQPVAPDNLIGSGSCVNIAENGDAIEVPCDGSNDGVVASFRGDDPICPQGTEEHRDHQGLGPVCVRMSDNG